MSDTASTKQISQQIIENLLPLDCRKTEELVNLSGLNRFKDFFSLATYLLYNDAFATMHSSILDTLEQYKSEPENIFYHRLSSPLFRGWLNQFGRVQNWSLEEPILRHLLGFWNNMRFDIRHESDYKQTLKVINGYCMTWDPRVTVRVNVEDEVIIAKSGNNLMFLDTNTGEKLIEVEVVSSDPLQLRCNYKRHDCELPMYTSLPETTIALRNDLPLLQLKLRETQVPERHSGLEYGLLDHRMKSYPAFNAEPFIQSAELLKTAWPEEYDDFKQTLQIVVPRAAPKGWTMAGFTVSSYQGACWIAAQGTMCILETLVHEQSHVKLRYIEETFPILKGEQSEQVFSVGWRSDPRPIVGIYEGVYVHIHSLLALKKVLEYGLVAGSPEREYTNRISQLKSQIEEGIHILKHNAKFTDEGTIFIDWAADEITRI